MKEIGLGQDVARDHDLIDRIRPTFGGVSLSSWYGGHLRFAQRSRWRRRRLRRPGNCLSSPGATSNGSCSARSASAPGRIRARYRSRLDRLGGEWSHTPPSGSRTTSCASGTAFQAGKEVHPDFRPVDDPDVGGDRLENVQRRVRNKGLRRHNAFPFSARPVGERNARPRCAATQSARRQDRPSPVSRANSRKNPDRIRSSP